RRPGRTVDRVIGDVEVAGRIAYAPKLDGHGALTLADRDVRGHRRDTRGHRRVLSSRRRVVIRDREGRGTGAADLRAVLRTVEVDSERLVGLVTRIVGDRNVVVPGRVIARQPGECSAEAAEIVRRRGADIDVDLPIHPGRVGPGRQAGESHGHGEGAGAFRHAAAGAKAGD